MGWLKKLFGKPTEEDRVKYNEPILRRAQNDLEYKERVLQFSKTDAKTASNFKNRRYSELTVDEKITVDHIIQKYSTLDLTIYIMDCEQRVQQAQDNLNDQISKDLRGEWLINLIFLRSGCCI